MPIREAEIGPAVRWLQDHRVKDRESSIKAQYLTDKGLTPEEVEVALERACGNGEDEPLVATLAGDKIQKDPLFDAIVKPVAETKDEMQRTEKQNEDELRGQVFHALMKMKGGGTLGGHADGPAHLWHSRRREALMRRPAVKALLRDHGVGNRNEITVSISIVIILVIAHFLLGRALTSFATTHVWWQTSLLVLLCSATLGAQCAYLLQALNHEIGHGAPQVNLGAESRKYFYYACYSLCSVGSSLCHVPWSVYYMGGGHMRHHRYVGSARDVDEDALFVLYQPSFTGPLARLGWLSVASLAVPVLMFFSLIRCAMFDWRSNIKELSLCTLDFALTGITFYMCGGTGAMYLFLSSAMSMGFLCHPLVGFWILQHLCINKGQPTTSYCGSWLWNTLCLNELLHVEHHDLAGISWRHLPKLREEAPELYEHLHAEESIISLIGAWARAYSPDGDKRFQFDFACRTEWGYTRKAAAATAQMQHAVMKSLQGQGSFLGNGGKQALESLGDNRARLTSRPAARPAAARNPGSPSPQVAKQNPQVMSPAQDDPMFKSTQVGASRQADIRFGQQKPIAAPAGERWDQEPEDDEHED